MFLELIIGYPCSNGGICIIKLHIYIEQFHDVKESHSDLFDFANFRELFKFSLKGTFP